MSNPAELENKLRQIQSGRNEFVDMLQQFDDYVPDLIQEMVYAHANDAGWIERNAKTLLESRDPSLSAMIQHAKEEDKFGKRIRSLHDDQLKKNKLNFASFKTEISKENQNVTQNLRNLRSSAGTPAQSQAPPPRGPPPVVSNPQPNQRGAPITESQEMAEIMRQIAEQEAKERSNFGGSLPIDRPLPVPNPPLQSQGKPPLTESQEMADIMRQIAEQEAKESAMMGGGPPPRMPIIDAQSPYLSLPVQQSPAFNPSNLPPNDDMETIMRQIAQQNRVPDPAPLRDPYQQSRESANRYDNTPAQSMQPSIYKHTKSPEEEAEEALSQLRGHMMRDAEQHRSGMSQQPDRRNPPTMIASNGSFGGPGMSDMPPSLPLMSQQGTRIPDRADYEKNSSNFAQLLGMNIDKMTSEKNIRSLDEDRYQTLNDNLASMKHEAGQIQHENVRLQETSVLLEDKLTGLRNLNEFIKADINKVTTDYDRNRFERQTLTNEVRELEQELQQLEREIGELTRENESNLNANQDLRTEKAQVQGQIQHLDVEIERYRTGYESLKQRWDDEILLPSGQLSGGSSYASRLQTRSRTPDRSFVSGRSPNSPRNTDLSRDYSSIGRAPVAEYSTHRPSISAIGHTAEPSFYRDREILSPRGSADPSYGAVHLLSENPGNTAFTSGPSGSSYADRYLRKDFRKQ